MTLQIAPSKEAVVKFLTQQPSGTQALITTFLSRTFLIGLGIHALGSKDNIVRNSFAASTAIELYLLWHYKQQINAE